MIDYNGLNFKLSSSENMSREAYRTSFRGLVVRIDNGSGLFEVVDISATGCSIKVKSFDYEANQILDVDIIISNKVIVRSLQTEIVRLLSDSVIACAFRELSRKQEYDLDKLILEIQKKQISSMKF